MYEITRGGFSLPDTGKDVKNSLECNKIEIEWIELISFFIH